MDVTLPADLSKQVEQELASGRYHSSDELIEEAVRSFLDDRQRGHRRPDALRRIGQAVVFSTHASSPVFLYVTLCCALPNVQRFLSQSGRRRSFGRPLERWNRSWAGRSLWSLFLNRRSKNSALATDDVIIGT